MRFLNTSLLFSVSLLCFLLSHARAGIDFTPELSHSRCQSTLTSKTVAAEICRLPLNGEIVTVSLYRKDSPLIIQALFDTNENSWSTRESSRFWRRLWISSGSPVITEEEQAAIREAIGTVGLEAIDSKTLAVVDFIANFIEPNEVIPEFDATAETNLRRGLKSSFTMICDLIGKANKGQYIADDKLITSSAIVGDPATKCKGRCGLGCYQFMQWRPQQYTQECFEHDLCHLETGSILGPCSDSFWKAYYGYMNAPNCPDTAPANDGEANGLASSSFSK